MQIAEKLETTVLLEDYKQNDMALFELRFCDRVYKYPEKLPAEVFDKLIELVAENRITLKELNYLNLILIKLPLMNIKRKKLFVNCSENEKYVFAENDLSFGEYVDYQIERMKRMGEHGIGKAYSKRIREILLRFRNLS